MRQLLKVAIITVLLVGCKKATDLQTTATTNASAATPLPVFIRIQAVDNDGFITLSPIVYVKIK